MGSKKWGVPSLSTAKLADHKISGPLRIVFPATRDLLLKLGWSGLGLSVRINRSGYYCVSAGREVRHFEGPENPGVLSFTIGDCGRAPRTIVDFDFNFFDRRLAAPRRPSDFIAVTAVCFSARDPCDDGLQ